tara:strand:+ start:1465 stop:1773 length:309 start_codon:yes stop_codon:yes gene_type:complete
MAFKLDNAPYKHIGVPVYNVDLGPEILGKANRNGTILVNMKLTPIEQERVLKHELIHIDQFKNNNLDYDDRNVYWKGRTYPRDKMSEGSPELPWEAEAYKKT